MIVLSEKAIGEIRKIVSELGEGEKYLRAGVSGGGCHGFNYVLNIDDQYSEARDIMYEQDGIKIIVDKRSDLYMTEVTVDFHEDLARRGFVFNNPTAKGGCNCGSSH
jgi:iron-sulfur cluster assembly protein